MTVQAGLCRTWSETQIVGFLTRMLCHINCTFPYHVRPVVYEPRREKTGFLHCSNCTADLRLVFATRIVQFFFYLNPKFQVLTIFSDCIGRFVQDPVGNPEDRFSRVAAHILACILNKRNICSTMHVKL